MLSVVIPVRNGADVIDGMLDSLRDQIHAPDWELVVVDNGSTDDTAATVEARGDEFELRLISAHTRPGRHHACNVGVRASTGEAIVFLDADDQVEPGFLASMQRALAAHPLVAPRLVHIRGDGTPEPAVVWQTLGVNETTFLPTAQLVGFRRSVFEALEGFDENMDFCEDTDLCWRAELAGYSIWFAPDAVVRYRQRPDLRSMFRQHYLYGQAWVRLFRKYRSLGMTRRSPREVTRDWTSLVRGSLHRSDAAARVRWVRKAGRATGRLIGSAKCRTLYL